MLIVANARVFGGGFQIAPGPTSPTGSSTSSPSATCRSSGACRIMGQLLRGTHGRASEVDSRAGRRIDLRFDAPPTYETDGEWRRAASADLTIDITPPVALHVLVPRES